MNKNIKNKLVTSGVLICTTIAPILTLTSCSTISQYCPPIITGDQNNPFQNGYDHSGAYFSLLDPYLQHARDKDNISIDSSLINIQNYLPSRYLYTSAFDNSFKLTINKFYSFNGYSNFQIADAKNYADNPYQIDINTYNDKHWITSDDKKLSFINKDGKLNSYQNLVYYVASNAVNTVSFNFLTMVNYMNNFVNKIISQPNDNQVNELLDNVFTHSYANAGFNHGNRSSEDNYNFFQFCYDTANLMSTGDSQYKFGPYRVNWNQEYSGVDSGLTIADDDKNNTPFIKLDVQDLRSNTDHPFNIDDERNASLPYFIPTNTAFTGTYTYDTVNKKYVWQPASEMSPYCIYSYANDDKKHEYDPVDVVGIANIPTIIHLSGVDNGYYNPTNASNSININDWLIPSTKISNINKVITDGKQWKNFTNHVDGYTGIDTVSFTQNFVARDDTQQIDYADWKAPEFDTKNIDPTIENWCNNNIIKPGDYIALAQYSLMDITFKYYDTNGNEVNYRTKMPYFSGFGAIIPAYFAFNADYYSPIDSIKENDNHMILNFAEDSKLYKDWINIIKTLTSFELPKIDTTTYSTSYEAFINDPYMIFRWMFGGYKDTGATIKFNDSDPVNSSSFYINHK